MQDKTRASSAFSHLQKCKKFYTPEYEVFYTFLFEKIFLINLKKFSYKPFPSEHIESRSNKFHKNYSVLII